MSRPRLLYIVHRYFNRAGVEHHVRYLRDALANDYEIYVLARDDTALSVVGPDNSISEYPSEPRTRMLNKANEPATEQSLETIFGDLHPALVHVQHFADWPLSLFESVARSGVPHLASFHDHYAITPHATLYGVSDPRRLFEPATARKFFGQDLSRYLHSRLATLRAALSGIEVKVVPSRYLQKALGEFFPDTFRIIPNGIPFFPRPAQRPVRSPIRFATLGSILPQKGIEFAIKAFASFNIPRERAELHVYGGEGPKGIPGVTFHGAYEPSELPRILAEVDVGILPSLVPETYSMTLSELWMAGVVPCVSDIGALGERVLDNVNGRKFRPGSVDSLRAAVEWFLSHPEWRGWELPHPRTVTEMADDFRAIYGTLAGGAKPPRS